ncbi:MAG: metallophosphoesterase [Clostridia bacterium]|nr:metallophosphoesterase [Clostridia bacterium]
MKIGFFSDPHCGSEELCCGTRRPVLSLGKMKKALEYFRSENVGLVVCCGDLINGSGNVEEGKAYLRRATDLMRESKIPFYCVIGNHDLYDFDRETYYHAAGLPPLPFSTRADSVTLVFIDACYTDNGKTYFFEEKKADWKNTFVPYDQIDMFRDFLCHAPADEKIWLISHQSIDPLTEKSHIIRDSAAIRDVISEYGRGRVKRAICGHYHAGGEHEINGVKYTVIRGMCNGEESLPRSIRIFDTEE